MRKMMILVAFAAMTLAPMTASAARVFVGAGFYGGPYWGPYWGPGYAYAMPVTGEVKIDTKLKDAQVFINGSFAGTTKDAKNVHLAPGTYNIEVRYPGGQPLLSQQVFVAAGKTLHLRPTV